LKSQRTPADFRNNQIKSTRALVADQDYSPSFANTPLVEEVISIELSPDEYAAFARNARRDIYGTDMSSALRDLVFTWWENKYLNAASGAPRIEHVDVEER
jgi:uncharacterized protein